MKVTDEGGEVPGRPAAPTFGTTTLTGMVVNWVAPSNAGPPITGYHVWYREVTTPAAHVDGRGRHGHGHDDDDREP